MRIEKMSHRVVQCRSDGHHWKHVLTMRTGRSRVQRDLVCGVCRSSRVDEVNYATGEVEGRHYSMTRGYLIKGEGRQSRTVFRRAVVKLELAEPRLGPLKPDQKGRR